MVTAAMDRIYRQPDAMVSVQDGERTTRVISGNHDSVVVWTLAGRRQRHGRHER